MDSTGSRNTSRPEWELLLAALTVASSDSAHAPVQLSRAIEARPDWQKLLRLADHHGVSSLLLHKLSGLGVNVPANVLAELARKYEINVRKSLFLARELFRILDCAQKLGIELIPYKGLVLSETYYGDMAARHSGDLDLFVRKNDVMRLKEPLSELGYAPRVAISKNAERDYLAYGYECTFDSPAGKNLLELQWALQPRFYAVDYDMEGLFSRAINVAVAGRNVKTPSPEDLMLVLSLHAAKHVWGSLIWLCDIERLLRKENVNWDWVRAEAGRLGIVRIVHITLILAGRLVGAEIPKSIEKETAQDRAAETFADQIANDIGAQTSYGEEQLSYFQLMMRLRERRADRWRFFWRLALTPGPGEWGAVHLPKPLFPLYRAVRLARLAARFARG